MKDENNMMTNAEEPTELNEASASENEKTVEGAGIPAQNTVDPSAGMENTAEQNAEFSIGTGNPPTPEAPKTGPKEPDPAIYAFQWDYRTQYEREQNAKKTVEIRAGLLYTLIVAAIFAVAIAVLAIVLAVGSSRETNLPSLEGSTAGGTVSGNYTERVVYVNGDGDAEEALAVEAAVAKMLPSTVSVLVTKSTGASGVGSGIVFSEDGYIVTNHHVISEAVSVTVQLYGGDRYTAEIVGSDELSDLALLKIAVSGLTPAEFGESDELLIGETVMAIGTPTGINYSETVTRGIVSCKTRAVKVYGSSGSLSHTLLMVQTDASVNPGNSGGALIDRNGEVVGVITQKPVFYEDGTAYFADGMGLAIPSSAAKKIVTALRDGTEPDRTDFLIKAARLGITGRTVTTGGVSVEGFTSEKFDAASKLEIGDIISAVNGTSVTNISSLLVELENYVPGASVTLTVLRGTETLSVELILGSDDLV